MVFQIRSTLHSVCQKIGVNPRATPETESLELVGGLVTQLSGGGGGGARETTKFVLAKTSAFRDKTKHEIEVP